MKCARHAEQLKKKTVKEGARDDNMERIVISLHEHDNDSINNYCKRIRVFFNSTIVHSSI